MAAESGFQLGEDAPRHYQAQVQRVMAPFVRALVAAGVRTGDGVLDVACGTGFATRAASLASGPSGTLVGTDLNPAMLAIAESVPHDGGAPIAWRAARAAESGAGLPGGRDRLHRHGRWHGVGEFLLDQVVASFEPAKRVSPACA